MRINLPPRERCFSGSVGNPPQFLYEGLPIIGCNEVNFERAMGGLRRPPDPPPTALEIHKVGRHLYPRDGTRQILRGAAQFLMMVHPLRGRIAAEPLRQAPFPSIVAQHVIFK
jgi:hypothetical protein